MSEERKTAHSAGPFVCQHWGGREGIVFRSETQLPVASCFEVTSTYTSHVCTLIRGKIGGCVWRPSNEKLGGGLWFLVVPFPGGGAPLLGCLLAWTLVLAPCFFFSPFLECFLFYKVWQGFIKAWERERECVCVCVCVYPTMLRLTQLVSGYCACLVCVRLWTTSQAAARWELLRVRCFLVEPVV
jgi:hypothetical protein